METTKIFIILALLFFMLAFITFISLIFSEENSNLTNENVNI